MFTGIVQSLVPVLEVQRSATSLRARLDTGFEALELGESIAVNGVCLTVAEILRPGCAEFFLSAETLARSNLDDLVAGTRVNLERAVTLATRLSGHWVQGHVDGVATLESVSEVGESRELVFCLPPALTRYCIEKGSITLNGISLTLNHVEKAHVSVMVIPHTWLKTNLSDLRLGSRVNLEVDLMAKYIEKLCTPYPKL